MLWKYIGIFDRDIEARGGDVYLIDCDNESNCI